MEVFRDGVSIGTTAADETGHWSFDHRGTSLAQGTYAFTAQSTELAGNVSDLSQIYTVVIDQTPPQLPVILDIKYDSGTSDTDNVTSVRQQIFKGLGVSDGTLELFLNSSSIGTTSIAGDGKWELDFTGQSLSDGEYFLTARATNYVGNVSELSTPFRVVIDGTAPNRPSVTGFSPDNGLNSMDGITSYQSPTIFGTAEPLSSVRLYRNGGSVGVVATDASGGWSFTSNSLGDGTHAFTAIATDSAGNVGLASTPLNITVDTKINTPKVTQILPDSGSKSDDEITNRRELILVGEADAGNIVQLYQNGVHVGEAVADATGTWMFDHSMVSLADGTYVFTAQALDAAGNVSQNSSGLDVVVDTQISAAVTAGMVKAVDGSGRTILIVSGTGEPQSAVNVYLNGTFLGTANVDSKGTWDYNYRPVSLANGIYNFTTKITDAAGNISDISPNYKLVLGNSSLTAAKPKLAGSSVIGKTADGTPITVATPTFTGSTKPGYTVTIVDNGVILGTVVADAAGKWTFTSPALARGKHQIRMSVMNLTGDTGLLSDFLAIQV